MLIGILFFLILLNSYKHYKCPKYQIESHKNGGGGMRVKRKKKGKDVSKNDLRKVMMKLRPKVRARRRQRTFAKLWRFEEDDGGE